MRGLRKEREVPVGHDEPRTPTRSLPSYKEPTPETHRRLTREDEAELALKRTVFTQWTPQVLIALFLATVALVPLIEIAMHRDTLHTFAAAIVPHQRFFPHAEDLKKAERTLETDSVVSQWLLPTAQSLLIEKLHAGSEQVYLGRDGWLFYRPDVDYVTGPGFLSRAQLDRRSHLARTQPNPVRAIVQFRDQLAARGIDLVVVPVPTKPSLQGEMLSTRVVPSKLLQNASFADFRDRLSAAGVRLFDPAPTILPSKDAPRYLERDTHWRPETMQSVAKQLAASLALPATNNMPFRADFRKVSGIGDLSRMLKLPDAQPQSVTIRQITSGTSVWHPDHDADVLLLGDSFSNIFSLEALGWGESAGFAEQLSYELKRPLDCILRNSDGAFATREMLAKELARGHDRLAGKKLVIWEFAARELAFGNWKLFDLALGTASPSRFFSPATGGTIEVGGTVEAVSSVPRPGSVPYADHVMSVHVTDLQLPDGSNAQAVVYLLSMRDNVWTPAAHLRPGDSVKLRLRNWNEVAPQFESINRSELDDPELQLEEPAWGDIE